MNASSTYGRRCGSPKFFLNDLNVSQQALTILIILRLFFLLSKNFQRLILNHRHLGHTRHECFRSYLFDIYYQPKAPRPNFCVSKAPQKTVMRNLPAPSISSLKGHHGSVRVALTPTPRGISVQSSGTFGEDDGKPTRLGNVSLKHPTRIRRERIKRRESNEPTRT